MYTSLYNYIGNAILTIDSSACMIYLYKLEYFIGFKSQDSKFQSFIILRRNSVQRIRLPSNVEKDNEKDTHNR